MPKIIARLLGLGAFAACVAIVLLFVLVAFLSRHTPQGGMDVTMEYVTWLSLGGVTLGIVILQQYLGRQFLLIAREDDAPQPLGAR